MRRITREPQLNYLKLILSACFLLCFTILFYRQAIKYNGMYISDLPLHIKFGLKGSGYSILYAIIGLLYKITHSYLVIAVFESFLLVLTFLLGEHFLKTRFHLDAFWSIVISACMLFLSSPYVWKLLPFFYKRSLITQPWHNITYIAMRLFAIIVLNNLMPILGHYNRTFSWKDWISVALPLFLSSGIKPNFLIAFCFALLFVLM